METHVGDITHVIQPAVGQARPEGDVTISAVDW